MTSEKSIEQLDVWQGVPKPERLIECVKQCASEDLLERHRGLSGLRGALKVLKTLPDRARVTRFLQWVVRKYQ